MATTLEPGSPADRVLWGVGTTRTIRAHWALRELGLDYRTEAILPRTAAMQRPDFTAISPRGKVPILDDDGLLVGESAAIVLYLADRYRDADCMLGVPVDDHASRAAYYDLCFYILTELDATTLYVLRRHEGLSDIYGEAPVAATAAREYFTRQLGEMERRLEAQGPYLLGEVFTSPDLLLTTCLDWARFVGFELSASLAEYCARIARRPAYAKAMAVNYAPLAELSK